MTINAKMTLFWSTPYNEGWSESFYLGQTDISAAQSHMDTLIPLFQACRTTAHELVYARVSDQAIKGDSLVTTLGLPMFGTHSLGTNEHLLEGNTCLLCTLFASSTVKNHTFFRGLTTDTVQGRLYVTSGWFPTAFSTLAAALIVAAAECRHRTSKGPPPTYTYVPATSYSIIKATARKPGRPFGIVRGREVQAGTA
jgi:hypothetical protein